MSTLRVNNIQSVTPTDPVTINDSLNVSGSLTASGSEGIVFHTLPKRNVAGSGLSTGRLFTVSGSQLPFSGSITELNAVSASLFVMVKA